MKPEGAVSCILVVEDDARTAQYVAQGLAQEGYSVRVTHTGESALSVAGAQEIDLIILDVMLPKLDGVGVVQRLRKDGQKIPVLMLTARDGVGDRVRGLEAGADDYLTKPFAFEELLARVRALLRRSAPPVPLRRAVADLEVDLETRRVTRGGRPVELTPREFDLVAYLVCHAGEIVDRERLAREVWRMTERATPIDNVIDVYVSRVRRKVDEGEAVKLLHVVRGLGVMISAEAPKV